MENNAATDKAPSTHTSSVVPATTEGTSPDLYASLLSANAEQFYQYQPTEIIVSDVRLVDSQGYGVAGVNYYTRSGRGVTDENGKFSFSWGETISFGIDTFELCSDPQGYPDRVRQRRATGIWVYERYPAADGAQPPYTIDPNTGEVTWKYKQDNKPDDKPKLEFASWKEEVEGKQVTRYAFIDEAEYTTEESLEAAKAKIFEKFPVLQECKDSTYHYEINCLERRPGTDVPVTGAM